MADTSLLHTLAFSYLYRNRLSMAHRLLDAYGSAAQAWLHIDEPEMEEALTKATKELDFIDKHAIRIYSYGEADYPYRLSQCPDAPLVLYGKGAFTPNSGRYLSVVGTRSATERGKETTRRLILDLAALVPDVTIVSGLAFGIDVAAHRAALEAGLPTLIIPGHGLDRIYPALHRPVAVQALQHGGILTEYMSETEPLANHFVARDRIIAGLSDATLVVESKERGGSLITARMAQDYNREVFAIPGRPTDVTSVGCNNLIRTQRAALVTGAEDLAYAMQWIDEKIPMTALQTALTFDAMDETARTLIDMLHQHEDGMHINLIVMESGMKYQDVSAKLMMMEIDGLVKSLPGGMYRALK